MLKNLNLLAWLTLYALHTQSRVECLSTCVSLIYSSGHTINTFNNVSCQSCPNERRLSRGGTRTASTGLNMGLLGDLFKDAFTNDENLSSDKASGQLEYEGDSDSEEFLSRGRGQQTEVQKRWMAAQIKIQEQKQKDTPGRMVKGAPINPDMLVGTKWILDLYLAGVPKKDPSNDLYGSKINISSRDRSFGLGVEVPEEPSVSVLFEFGENGVCRAEPNEFTSGNECQYKLSDDNKFIRFSLDTLGFQRIVTTTGSITKVFWSDGDNKTRRTSSTYSIPQGLVYADVAIGYGKPGELIMGERENGILRIEQSMGLLGAASKMLTCGKFSAKMMID